MTAQTAPSPTTLDAWKNADYHEVTLPSGAVVTIRPLDLEMHMMLGDTPGNLRSHVLANLGERIASGQMTNDQQAEAHAQVEAYNKRLIVQSLVDPKIEEDDLKHLPERDTKMILQIAMRHRDTDAAGKSIGVVPLGDSSDGPTS